MTLIGRHWLPLGPDLTAGTARYAGQNARAQPLRLHGLPGPLATYRNSSGREVQIVAVSWGPWHDPLDHPAADGLQLTFYSHPTPLFRRTAFTGGTVSPDAAALLNPVPDTIPRCCPTMRSAGHLTDLDEEENIDGTVGSWALIVGAAWRLMRQP